MFITKHTHSPHTYTHTYSKRMGVHGTKIRVDVPLKMVAWNYYNAPGLMDAHGMNGRVPMRPDMAIYKHCSGRVPMAVLGMDKHV